MNRSINIFAKTSSLILIGSTVLGSFGFAQEIVQLQPQEEMYQSQETPDNFNIENAANTMKWLQTSIDDITKQLYELDAKEKTGENQDISSKYRETRAEIVRIIWDINKTTDYVGSMLKKIAVYKKQIALGAQELTDTREGITNTKEYVEQFTNFMYKLDNELYNKDNEIDEIKLLMKSDNIPRTLANDYMVKSIILQFNDLINNLNSNESKQIKILKKLNTLKVQAKNSIQDYETSLEKLNQKKNYLMQFMQLYKDNKLTDIAQMGELFNSRKDVENAISSMIEEISRKKYDVKFDMDAKMKDLEAIYEKADEEATPLAWPIYPIDAIEHYFGDKTLEQEYGVPFKGIQIKAIQGSPVYAARDGIVYHVTNNDGIGINRVMILHSKWYISTYLYLNNAMIQPGDIVRRGQLIGYSWWEPGTRGAWFISKGANLTFTVYKDGVAIDPLQVLDLSVIMDKSIIPEEYSIKYLNDKYARSIDITDLQFMSGDTVLARADNFLTTYGKWIYREVAFWEDAVKDSNIDRDVAICIWFAESTLGNYLTTSNNIGNVGNNDRWDRVPFSSALAGARSIADTLNNQHLGHYHTIKQLSRYGNKDGKIYASSTINWQTNVVKCLSQIKGYYVPDDFPFRTGQNPNAVQNSWDIQNITWNIQ